jgi:predicted amidohydrolase
MPRTRYLPGRMSIGLNGWYSPGTSPVVIRVDGHSFGLALCIEVQFPEVFMKYGRLGADAVLLSSYTKDPIFHVLAQAHAAANNLWVSVSTPAQCAASLPVAVFAPDGSLAGRGASTGVPTSITTVLDRDDERYDIALKKARPWRMLAREGNIYYRSRQTTSVVGTSARYSAWSSHNQSM